MRGESMTVEAVFQNGVLRPSKPLPLKSNQKVTLTVHWPTAENIWPSNTAEIYRELAEEDQRLAEAMQPLIQETWPKKGG